MWSLWSLSSRQCWALTRAHQHNKKHSIALKGTGRQTWEGSRIPVTVCDSAHCPLVRSLLALWEQSRHPPECPEDQTFWAGSSCPGKHLLVDKFACSIREASRDSVCFPTEMP